MKSQLRTWAVAICAVSATIAPRIVAAGEPGININIGSTSGAPGAIVSFDVTLDNPTNTQVVDTSNDFTFPAQAPVLGANGGRSPSCAVNPQIGKEAYFEFLPGGCGGTTACTGVDALLVAVSNDTPIATGTVLYTCSVEIAPNADPGTYEIQAGLASVMDSNQQQFEVGSGDGAVTVAERPLACVGDCDGDGTVTVSDLISGVNISLSNAAVDTCPVFDRDADGLVAVNELIQAVNGALAGCLPDADRCEREAAISLNTCIGAVSAAQEGCYADAGTACAPDDTAVGAALDALEAPVREACRDAATVQAAGYGPAFTLDGLVGRLQAACRAEPASLAARSFGGPQGAALATGTAQAVACISQTHEAAAQFVRASLAVYSNCVTDADGSCTAEQAAAQAAALQQQLARDIDTRCGAGALQGIVAMDAPAYADRTAAQARCLTAVAHPDPSPLSLDCGPRDGLANTPRGEYVQIVLDEEEYGTRCGNGSPFAFWVRLAPEGQPVENVVVGMQGGGVCIFNEDCRDRPEDLFEAMSDQPETGGPLSNDPEISPFADWTKVYLPYCNQDVFIGGGSISNFPDVTVHRFGAVNVRAAMRYVRDVVWRDLDQNTEAGYTPDRMRVLFGGFSAGAFGTIYNYHYLLDDLQWAHSAGYPDAGLALDNGEALGVASLGALLIADVPPLSWGSRNYLPPYCFAFNCGVGPVLLEATAPRLKAVPEQQLLILSNQVDDTQVGTTFFSSRELWINEMRASYCETRDLNGVQYYLPAVTENVHVISPRTELYTNRPVDGVIMRDWLEQGFTSPDTITDHVEEGELVTAYPGVDPFPCDIE